MKNKIFCTFLGVMISSAAFSSEKQVDGYSAHYGEVSKKQGDILYLDSQFNDSALTSESLEQAIDVFVRSFKKQTKLAAPSVIIRKPISIKYNTPIRIEKGTKTMASAINEICVQAGARWNYSNGRITIQPKKQTEQGAAGNPLPAE